MNGFSVLNVFTVVIMGGGVEVEVLMLLLLVVVVIVVVLVLVLALAFVAPLPVGFPLGLVLEAVGFGALTGLGFDGIVEGACRVGCNSLSMLALAAGASSSPLVVDNDGAEGLLATETGLIVVVELLPLPAALVMLGVVVAGLVLGGCWWWATCSRLFKKLVRFSCM